MTTDIQRDLHLLISIARIDASISQNRIELNRLPAQIEKLNRSIADIEAREQASKTNLEELTHEKRQLEQGVEDNTAKVTQYKTQLMQVKTNKEYTAMLHEIEHVEKDTEEKEERLLMLMDEIDQRSGENEEVLEEGSSNKQKLQAERAEVEARVKQLEAEVEKLEADKPKLLLEVSSVIKKRYDRLMGKYGDTAVTHLVDDTCQGCHTRIPPQTAVEVRKNNQLIACEACGRMLVHYDA